MVLYFAVGLTTGGLVTRLKGTQQKLERTADDLLQSIEQLRSTEDRLLQSARLAAVGRLSAGLAHEIRNPLAAIKGSAEILADDFPPTHPKRRLLDVLVGESVRLNSVLTRFLAFARPRPIDQQDVDVHGEIQGVVSLLRLQEEGRSVGFVIEPVPEGIGLQGDRELLRQLLLNLLLNACQASGGSGTVEIRCDFVDGMCRIVVMDSGPGFTPEAIENAFTPFFTTKREGSGLGLAISHRIVEQHGGTIRLSNRESGGGRVEVRIPAQGRRDG
jgi:signal transduction histidine kinase